MTVAHAAPPPGIRNNNPLNIRLNLANDWQGRIDPDENTDGEFEQFANPVWGLRAAAVLIIAHYDKRGANTIRKLLQQYYKDAEGRAFVARLTNAENKYKYFLKRYRHLANRVPLKYIASFLGITLETLSRTRKKMSNSRS